MNHKPRFLVTAALALAVAPSVRAADDAAFRPPAVPLVTFDPYLSVWSEADHLTDKNTQHWTHREHSLVSLIRVDGRAFRLMGDDPDAVPALPQTGLQVTPTRSIYQFENPSVHVTLTFMTPALPSDLTTLARPVTYLTWDVRSVDGKAHSVSVYDSVSSELAVNTPDQKVTWGREAMGPLTALRVGTADQPYFDPAGDDTRIDWGYAYAVAPSAVSTAAAGADATLLGQFVSQGTLPAQDDARMPRAVSDDQPVLAFAFNLGDVGAAPVSRHLMVGYDEVYAIKYFGQRLRPYWRRGGTTPAQMFQTAERDYPTLVRRCTQFDQDLTADLTKEGGARYAQIAALSYRECLAGNGIAADAKGQPLMFSKESTSDGNLATVDVIFPGEPMWVLLNPALAKASLVSVLDYAASPHWKFPNAPHDLGEYPQAFGRDDGGEGMPVEESGNMLILCDAICRQEGNAHFVAKWWPQLTQWAKYLQNYGEDPEDQLCTDDFMGHLAHNANLSVKAIVALAAYGDLCRLHGDSATAAKYETMAKGFARHWMEAANDGDHYRLAFDRPNTWSQKYNLVWDRILGLNVFPPEVAQKEIAYYKGVMQPYGVPLDSRTHLTKTDWTLWSASMADNRADFEAMVSPIYDYLDQTTTRDPVADSYVTDNVHSGGMHARPVIGGLFIKMLDDPAMWHKWFKAGADVPDSWAPFPKPPTVTYVVPTAAGAPVLWRYTTTKNPPPADWYQPGFDDSGWQTGPAAFGTPVGWTKVRTPWTDTPGDLWLRRTFAMPAGKYPNLQFMVYHDEDVDIYVNGVLAAREAGFNTAFQPLEISPQARALLTPGARITLAAHVHQTEGGQGFDMGLANVVQH
ncbi:MAG: DUF5127 domain-containing protein [Armatimonadetes bacterium]|nr:DUF5127 domain-containing protein [Armatimonadota bacterium]